ncbi:MAG: MMPL family transporter [Anaerolineae bacterium]|jgi:RND superfamily putative drug exporter
MFQRLGRLVAQYRFAVIAVWIGLAAILTWLAPSLEAVSSSDQKDFLPEDAPFVRAQEVQARVFADQSAASSSMVVVDAGPGGDVHEPRVWAFVADLEAWLAGDGAPDNVSQVAGPATAAELADKLISPDGRLALVGVGLTTHMDAQLTSEAVTAIDEWLAENTPAGIKAYQSGEAALNAQAEESALTTMDRTLWITIVLVIVALLAIYRSPVSPLVPLFAVTMALVLTLAVTGLLAEAGVITVLTEVQTILVAVMYGAGTDYCLFLISRFREEMADDEEVAVATGRTVHLVGETISSSAATVFVGFMSLVFAEMGVFRSAGPMLALGIAISLLSGLTLVPALLAVLGDKAFWPAQARHRASGRLYEATSKLVSSRPLLAIVLIVAVMAPLSVYGLSRDLSYDMVSELPDEIPSVQGYHLLQEEMGGGVLFPATVTVTGRDPEAMAAEIAHLTETLYRLAGVTDVRGLHTPLGYGDETLVDLLRVDNQLKLLLAMDEGEEATPDPQQAAATIEGMQGYMAALTARFPEIDGDENLGTAREILESGMLGVMMRQGELLGAVEGLIARFEGMEDAYLIPPMGEGALFAELGPLYEEYVSADGRAYRLELVLADPIGEAGFETINNVRRTLAEYEGEGEAVVGGFTAIYTDIHDIMNRDMYRAFAFVLAGVFVVLLLMLRSAVAPVYLIATVLLSFTCTLGLTSLLFDLVLGVERLSWLLPMFMFVFLVALGIDYSIFLFGRIKEEVAYHGIREGVHVAVARTGAIITSAGIILAGTFAGMMAGEIAFLTQLGFAVAVGVLIDTFVVRTMLDPALATLFGRWTWWPGGVPRAPERRPRPAPMAPKPGEGRL